MAQDELAKTLAEKPCSLSQAKKKISSVAEKFAKISLGTQVIAVSHLPQISAMADNNLLIEKGIRH